MVSFDWNLKILLNIKQNKNVGNNNTSHVRAFEISTFKNKNSFTYFCAVFEVEACCCCCCCGCGCCSCRRSGVKIVEDVPAHDVVTFVVSFCWWCSTFAAVFSRRKTSAVLGKNWKVSSSTLDGPTDTRAMFWCSMFCFVVSLADWICWAPELLLHCRNARKSFFNCCCCCCCSLSSSKSSLASALPGLRCFWRSVSCHWLKKL